MSNLGVAMVAELAGNESGLAIIYHALDRWSREHELADAAVVIDEPGLGRQVFRAGRKPLDDPGGEALLDAPPGLYTDPPLAARQRRRVARHQPVRRRAAHGGAALRLLARPAHRALRPPHLRPPARDVGRPQRPVPLAVHPGRSSTSTTSRRSTTPRATRPATPRSGRSASGSAGSCASVTTRPASAATSSR